MSMKRIAACLLIFALMPQAAGASDAKEVAAYLGEEMTRWRGVQTMDLSVSARLPVYTAPSREAYRGANGRAEISLKEPFDIWGTLKDLSGNGKTWLLIEYDIHAGKKRVGFVEKSALESFGSVNSDELVNVDLMMTVERDTVVTDDPHGSMRRLATIDKGCEVGAICRLDDTWAYISTEIEGKRAYGFVKMSDLRMPEETISREFMQKLTGIWLFAGGGGNEGGMIFGADGSYTDCIALDEEIVPPTAITPMKNGTYTIIENPGGSQREELCGPYEIIRRFDDGTIERNGIAFYEENRIHIAFGESGAFYVRGVEENVQGEKAR